MRNRNYSMIFLSVCILLIGYFWMKRAEQVNPADIGTITISKIGYIASTVEEKAQKGKPFTLTGIHEKDIYVLEVEKIEKDIIHLSTKNLSIKTGKDLEKTGINLNECKENKDKKQTFTLAKGERAELSTCSMDISATWEITYKK